MSVIVTQVHIRTEPMCYVMFPYGVIHILSPCFTYEHGPMRTSLSTTCANLSLLLTGNILIIKSNNNSLYFLFNLFILLYNLYFFIKSLHFIFFYKIYLFYFIFCVKSMLWKILNLFYFIFHSRLIH